MDTLTSWSVRMTVVIHGVRDSEITPQKSASRKRSVHQHERVSQQEHALTSFLSSFPCVFGCHALHGLPP